MQALTVVWQPGASSSDTSYSPEGTSLSGGTPGPGAPQPAPSPEGSPGIFLTATPVRKFVTTAAEVAAALTAANGAVTVIVDTRTAAANIDVVLDFHGRGSLIAGAAGASGRAVTVVAGTGQIKGLALADAIGLLCPAPSGVLPPIALSDGQTLRLENGADISRTGAANPALVVSSDTTVTIKSDGVSTGAPIRTDNSARPAVTLAANVAATTTLNLSQQASPLSTGAFSSPAATVINFTHDASIAVGAFATANAGALGTINDNGVGAASGMAYTAGVAGSWAGSPPTTVAAALDRLAADLKANLALGGGGAPVP